MTDAPDWEEPLPTLSGRVRAFGMRLAASDLLPARYAARPAAEARRHLFADLDPTLAAALVPDEVLVADEYVGTPTTARAAAAALVAAGIDVLVARTFAPPFETGAYAAGVVTVTLDAPAFVHTGDRVRIDLDAAKIVNLSSGDRAAIRNLDDERRQALRALFAKRGGPP